MHCGPKLDAIAGSSLRMTTEHDRHFIHTDADLARRHGGAASRRTRGSRRCWRRPACPACAGATAGFAGLCRDRLRPAAFDRQRRARSGAGCCGGVRSVPSRRAAARARRASWRGSACRGRRSRRMKAIGAAIAKGQIDLDAVAAHGGRRGARRADRAARHRPVDRRHLSAVLPRQRRRLAGRRPRAAGSGAHRVRSAAAARTPRR